jgi:hypothetical protein
MGAMGSKSANFYNAAFARQGYADDVEAVQALWLDGRRDEAAARVPHEIGFRTNLLGPPATVKERLRLYRDAGITSLQAKLDGPPERRLDTLAQLLGLAAEVAAEPSPAVAAAPGASRRAEPCRRPGRPVTAGAEGVAVATLAWRRRAARPRKRAGSRLSTVR